MVCNLASGIGFMVKVLYVVEVAAVMTRGKEVELLKAHVVVHIYRDVGFAGTQAEDCGFLGRAFQYNHHLVSLLADVVYHYTALWHTVDQVAVDEDRESLAMLALETYGVALGWRYGTGAAWLRVGN